MKAASAMIVNGIELIVNDKVKRTLSFTIKREIMVVKYEKRKNIDGGSILQIIYSHAGWNGVWYPVQCD